MKRLLVIVISILLAATVQAQPHLGMITSKEGEVISGQEKLRTLDFVGPNQQVQLNAGAKAVFSYIEGGKRYTVTGPCLVTFLKDGPRKEQGEGRIDAEIPAKRVGSRLPDNLNLDFGGQIRRGELKLHLSRCLLPGEQTLSFSGTPAYQRFFLTLFDSQGRKFESGELTRTEWSVPLGALKSGESYDVILEGVTDSGRTETVEREAIEVLDETTAEEVRRALNEGERATDVDSQVELLATLLHHQLDSQALECLQGLPQAVSSDSTLSALQQRLLVVLEYEGSPTTPEPTLR
jgi:hypothetical protein